MRLILSVGPLFMLTLIMIGCGSHPQYMEKQMAPGKNGVSAIYETTIYEAAIHEATVQEEIKPVKNTGEEKTEKPPIQLNGENEDESLKVSIHAELEADQQNYRTKIVFLNKTEQSMEIVADCGLFISNDHFAENEGICPAVDSMLLKGKRKETQIFVLPKNFFNMDDNVMTARYRKDRITNEIKIQLRAQE